MKLVHQNIKLLTNLDFRCFPGSSEHICTSRKTISRPPSLCSVSICSSDCLFRIDDDQFTHAFVSSLSFLQAGAGLVCLWALAVACVPQMQKGNETARIVHIGANLSGIGLFLWQLQSGIPILLKVWELTKFP